MNISSANRRISYGVTEVASRSLSVVLTPSCCPWCLNRVALMSGEFVNDSLTYCTPFFFQRLQLAVLRKVEDSSHFMSFLSWCNQYQDF